MSSISKRRFEPFLRCRMFSSEPVSRLSTQITRCPRASSSSHRWEPRKPAPPVTRQVAIGSVYARAAQMARLDVAREHVFAAALASREVDALEPAQHHGTALAAWLGLAAVPFDDDGSRHLSRVL